MTDKEPPEDLGAPVSYLVLADGTPVFDRSGERIGEVEHVLADEGADVFHGLLVKTAAGHRFARATLVDGLYEHGVIVAVPAAGLPEPSADPSARVAEEDEGLRHGLKKAWDWLVQPR
ncbi:PRC-barrel domain-containing protein [Paractinoplanes globisporus]|uniref:PRC-barrel domain-containing protein n=1 Tax=Paractinoplanes globisporus TaxID=113565 RepID=A0ABW6WD62_9ACTN|nr:PRC-barrel domain-containing protein [Actinoplanes globisporus]